MVCLTTLECRQAYIDQMKYSDLQDGKIKTIGDYVY